MKKNEEVLTFVASRWLNVSSKGRFALSFLKNLFILLSHWKQTQSTYLFSANLTLAQFLALQDIGMNLKALHLSRRKIFKLLMFHLESGPLLHTDADPYLFRNACLSDYMFKSCLFLLHNWQNFADYAVEMCYRTREKKSCCLHFC